MLHILPQFRTSNCTFISLIFIQYVLSSCVRSILAASSLLILFCLACQRKFTETNSLWNYCAQWKEMIPTGLRPVGKMLQRRDWSSYKQKGEFLSDIKWFHDHTTSGLIEEKITHIKPFSKYEISALSWFLVLNYYIKTAKSSSAVMIVINPMFTCVLHIFAMFFNRFMCLNPFLPNRELSWVIESSH